MREIRRAYGFDEVSIVPGSVTINPESVDTSVAIDGMNEVLPVGCSVPRLFKRIYVSYGAPVDYSDFLEGPRTRETAQALVDRVMKEIRVQHEQIRGTYRRGEETTEPSRKGFQ